MTLDNSQDKNDKRGKRNIIIVLAMYNLVKGQCSLKSWDKVGMAS